MDLGTIIGLLAGIGLLLWSILMASSIGPFIDYPSIIMVGGGTLCVAMMSFPMQNLFSVMKVVKNCFFVKARDPSDLIAELVKYAEIARRDGILALENQTGKITDPFQVAAIQMAVDGTDPELIEVVLNSQLEAVAARHGEGKAIFDNMGKYAPAFGMIGTLVGLVIMLKNMDDPKSIGPAMAVALLTTLYGALISNMVAGPMAEKLARRSSEEMMLKMMIIKGVMAIQSGDNPRIVEQKLQAFLPASRRRTVESREKAA